MNITQQALHRTLDSYRAAVDRAFAELGAQFIERDGGGGGLHLYVPDHVVARGVRREKVTHATRVWTRRDDLFEYGKPRHVEPGHWTWRMTYFQVRVYADYPISMFEQCPGGIEIDENDQVVGEVPPQMQENKRQLSVLFIEQSWGLADWRRKHDEIESFMDAAPTVVMRRYRDEVRKADKDVQEWQAALRKLSTVELPA